MKKLTVILLAACGIFAACLLPLGARALTPAWTPEMEERARQKEREQLEYYRQNSHLVDSEGPALFDWHIYNNGFDCSWNQFQRLEEMLDRNDILETMWQSRDLSRRYAVNHGSGALAIGGSISPGGSRTDNTYPRYLFDYDILASVCASPLRDGPEDDKRPLPDGFGVMVCYSDYGEGSLYREAFAGEILIDEQENAVFIPAGGAGFTPVRRPLAMNQGMEAQLILAGFAVRSTGAFALRIAGDCHGVCFYDGEKSMYYNQTDDELFDIKLYSFEEAAGLICEKYGAGSLSELSGKGFSDPRMAGAQTAVNNFSAPLHSWDKAYQSFYKGHIPTLGEQYQGGPWGQYSYSIYSCGPSAPALRDVPGGGLYWGEGFLLTNSLDRRFAGEYITQDEPRELGAMTSYDPKSFRQFDYDDHLNRTSLTMNRWVESLLLEKGFEPETTSAFAMRIDEECYGFCFYDGEKAAYYNNTVTDHFMPRLYGLDEMEEALARKRAYDEWERVYGREGSGLAEIFPCFYSPALDGWDKANESFYGGDFPAFADWFPAAARPQGGFGGENGPVKYFSYDIYHISAGELAGLPNGEAAAPAVMGRMKKWGEGHLSLDSREHMFYTESVTQYIDELTAKGVGRRLSRKNFLDRTSLVMTRWMENQLLDNGFAPEDTSAFALRLGDGGECYGICFYNGEKAMFYNSTYNIRLGLEPRLYSFGEFAGAV